MLQPIHDNKVLGSTERLNWAPPTDKNMTESGDWGLPQDVVVLKNGIQYGLSKLNLG